MNRRARDAFKAAKMEYRTADAEAEDQNTAMAIDSDNAAWHKKRGGASPKRAPPPDGAPPPSQARQRTDA